MFYFFALLPLIIFIISSYYFNNSKLIDSKFNIFLLSLLEATLSYLIIIPLFLQGFLSLFVMLPIIILLILIVAYILFSRQKELYDEWDLQIETIKCNIVLFMLTILPLYVFLTIFRYLEPYYQIPLAIFITTIIFYLSNRVNKSPIYEKIVDFISMTGAIKYVVLWLSIVIIFVLNILLQFPTNIVSESLNLSNNVKYLQFDGFPTDIQNNFYQKEIIQIDFNYHIDSEITDYYYDNTHLYIYTNKDHLIIYDLSTEKVVSDTSLFNLDIQLDNNDGMDDTELYNKFIYYDDYLILLGKYGTYIVSTDSVTKICEISSKHAKNFYLNNRLYFLNSYGKVDIFKFSEGDIKKTNINYLNTTDLLVISENLFSKNNYKYVLYENPSISFSVKNGSPIYDQNRHAIYYTQVYDLSFPGSVKYQKVDVNGETSTISINRIHNSKGIIIDDNIYFTEVLESDINRIEIINSDFEIEAIYNHLKLQPFWIGNKFNKSYIGNYHEKDNHLEFLQVEQNSKHIVLSIYQIHEKNVYLNLPFYTHYGLGIFIPILIAFFIPLTNYRKSITYIDFFTMLEKK